MSNISFYNILATDVRIREGLNACMNCGMCTAVCPAAGFFEYDPRSIAITVQSGNEENIRSLLESDTIWYCGQCMSCKTRCPRNNCPGLIISALRKVAQETGLFVKSKFGQQQFLITQTIGKNILKFGYCIHPTSVNPATHPEQGPVWQWVYNNMKTVYETVGANLDGDGAGAMRKIPDEDLDELKEIFNISGGTALIEKIEKYSYDKAIELGITDEKGHPDMEKYAAYLNNETNRHEE
ncbi:MAG: 4Fe-4S dicluster domain-containing protein [Mariniphaga sp.]